MPEFNEGDVTRDAKGKFAPGSTKPSTVDMTPSAPTLQSEEPLDRLRLDSYSKNAASWCSSDTREWTMVDAPYQRESVWDDDKRRALMNSLMRGIPVGVIVTNDRNNPRWEAANGPTKANEPFIAVVDGRQRLETLYAWRDDELSIPASWVEPDQVERTEETEDGPYVYRSDLTPAGRRLLDQRMQIPETQARLGSLQEEARLFRLVNGGGVAQTDETMANAAAIENR